MRSWASIFSRGARSAVAIMVSSRDTVDFSQKNMFPVYKTTQE